MTKKSLGHKSMKKKSTNKNWIQNLIKKIGNLSLLQALFAISILYFFYHNGLYHVQVFQHDFNGVSKNLYKNSEQKKKYLLGGDQSYGWIITYSNFIKKYSPKNARIFLPPQQKNWQMEGNAAYLRWYLYPRHLVGSEKTIQEIPTNVDYILIAYGNSVWQGDEYCWPRITLPTSEIEKIVFIDRKTLEEKELYNVPYKPDCMSESWGIIKLKRTYDK